MSYRTVQANVDSPVPVLLGHVRDEPRDLLSVEDDLGACTRLDEPIGVDQVTVELETYHHQHTSFRRRQDQDAPALSRIKSIRPFLIVMT